MPSLGGTDLAAVSTGSKLYLYYQNGNNIYETSSDKDGSNWTASSATVGSNAKGEGSPLTAYYVAHDGVFGGKSTIHVFYIDSSNHLKELVREVSKEGEWKENPLTEDIKKAPLNTSRLSSGVCHDTSPGAHQWVFFEILNSETGNIQIAELRSGSPDFKWKWFKELVKDHGTALPGTSIATNLTNPTTHLFFQDHAGNISEYLGGYDTWYSNKQILAGKEVQISTPLAAAPSSVADKPHLFYVGGGWVRDYLNGGKEVTKYVPGRRLGAARLGSKVYLFHNSLESTEAISTVVYDGVAWTKGTTVVPA